MAVAIRPKQGEEDLRFSIQRDCCSEVKGLIRTCWLICSKQSLNPRPNQPMADATHSALDEVDEDDFEEVGFDYLPKSGHSRQEKGTQGSKVNCNFQFYRVIVFVFKACCI